MFVLCIPTGALFCRGRWFKNQINKLQATAQMRKTSGPYLMGACTPPTRWSVCVVDWSHKQSTPSLSPLLRDQWVFCEHHAVGHTRFDTGWVVNSYGNCNFYQHFASALRCSYHFPPCLKTMQTLWVRRRDNPPLPNLLGFPLPRSTLPLDNCMEFYQEQKGVVFKVFMFNPFRARISFSRRNWPLFARQKICLCKTDSKRGTWPSLPHFVSVFCCLLVLAPS